MSDPTPTSALAFLTSQTTVGTTGLTTQPDPAPDPSESLPTNPGQSLVTVGQSLADFLGTSAPPLPSVDLPMHEPPDLSHIREIVLNFATSGLSWQKGDRPIGVTVGTIDGELIRFLPFRFAGGNHDEAVIKRWLQEQVKHKHITNANTRFDLHMARVWGVDLEAQGNTFSDIQHTAALLDDHRKQFKLDILAKDYLHDEELVARLDENSHSEYHADSVAMRELFSVYIVGQLREVLYPKIEAEGLRKVHDLEDAVIPVVVECEKNGSPLDLALLNQMERECRTLHGKLMLEIAQDAGFPFEITATGWKRLFEYCHFDPSEDGYAEDIVGTIDHPTIKKAHFAGQLASLNSKVFTPYREQVQNGILYYDINQLKSDKGGTVSGRFSAPLVHQCPNHDNHHAVFGAGDTDACGGLCDLFPRRLFIPGSGEYLEADAAQIEFRLLAHEANNQEILRAYREDPTISFHKQMWTMLKQYKADMSYSNTKNFDFANQYGAKSIKLAVMMNMITAKEGEEIRAAKRWNDSRLDQIHQIEAAFKQAMPEGGYLLDLCSHLAKPKCDGYCKTGDHLHKEYEHQGYIDTLLGRRSRFPDGYKSYIALNRKLQGGGADILKQKMVELHKERKQTGFLMRATVHDSVLGDAQTPETKGLVETLLNQQSFDLRVPVLWEVGAGRNWAGCK